MDKSLAFFVENISDIKAVLELDAYAKGKLPREIMKLLYEGVKREYHHWSWGPDDGNVRTFTEADEFGWYDRRWLDRDEENGLYFGAENFTAASFIELDDEDDRPYLYLFQSARVGDLTVKALTPAIAKVRSTAFKLGEPITGPEENKWGTYLAKQSLGNAITIETLKDAKGMCSEFLRLARKFTEALAPVIYRTAKIV